MRKHQWLEGILVLAMAVVLALAPALAQEGGTGDRAITPEEVVKRLNDGSNGLLVDVRTQEEYDESHIPGAVLAPLDTIGEERPQALGDVEQELYVYCRTGVRSKEALAKLQALGYVNVYDLGGIVDWPYETVSTQEEVQAAQQEQQVEQLRKSFLSSFTATDLEGNPVDQSLFADYRLTMVNVWATFCQPCLSEMPELGRLAQDYRDKGVQIVGLVSDALDMNGGISQDQVDFAKEIVAKTGAAYPHLLPSQDLINTVLWQVSAVPMTFFVDQNGGLVGYAYTGAADYAAWAQRIEETLAGLEQAGEGA